MNTAHAIHRTGTAIARDAHLVAANDPARDPIEPPRYVCTKCGTRYFEPQDCDWCPGSATQPEVSNPAN